MAVGAEGVHSPSVPSLRVGLTEYLPTGALGLNEGPDRSVAAQRCEIPQNPTGGALDHHEPIMLWETREKARDALANEIECRATRGSVIPINVGSPVRRDLHLKSIPSLQQKKEIYLFRNENPKEEWQSSHR